MARALIVFLLLQIADLATTIVTLRLGGAERNPLIKAFMSIGPVSGLVLAKLSVLLFAIACMVWKQRKALHLANAAFAVIVIWNLIVIQALRQ